MGITPAKEQPPHPSPPAALAPAAPWIHPDPDPSEITGRLRSRTLKVTTAWHWHLDDQEMRIAGWDGPESQF